MNSIFRRCQEFNARNNALLSVGRDAKRDAPAEELLDMAALFPDWAAGVAYKTGDLVNYAGNLYRVVWDHTSQPNWDPINGPSNFDKIANPAIEYPDWVQPYAHNPYKKGDRVTYNGKRWISEVDGNTHPPGVVAGAWKEVVG